jgi:formylglycine-generating enzyme
MLHGLPPRRYRFASFEFRESTGELWRDGQDLHLPEQAGQVLLALLQSAGEVVSRETLKRLLWPDKTHGDLEGGINAAVRKLRQVLGDDGEEFRFIGTLPRRGYRLVVAVESLEDGLGEGPPTRQSETTTQEIPVLPGGRRWRWKATAGVLATLLAVGGILAYRAARKGVAPVPAGEEVPGFLRVRAGRFMMGSPVNEKFRMADESQHLVTLSRDFLMAKYCVTVREFEEFVLSSGYTTDVERRRDGWVLVGGVEQLKTDASWRKPYFLQSDQNPVVLVTWDDALAYCNWRSRKEGLSPVYARSGTEVRMDRSAGGYRLPTESEWEYAARGGEEGAKHYTKFAGSDDYDEVAWCSRNAGGGTHPVGQKKPNALGLYDMCGNVDQWCWDLYDAYPNAPAVDPVGGSTGIWRVHRGGSWLASPGQYVRIAYRYVYKTETRTSIGFRVVRNP